MFDSLTTQFSNALRSISGKSKISADNIEETLKDVRKALLEADVNFKVAKDFIQNVKTKALGEKVLKGVNPGEQFIKILHTELTDLMGKEDDTIVWDKRSKPLILLMVGPNGVGKTTFCGKIALHLKTKCKKTPYLVPADTYRPAAKDQLITHAKNIQVDYFDSDLQLPVHTIASQAITQAQNLKNIDVIIIDTAGRLEVNVELMDQLKSIKETINSFGLETEVLLVADAMTGQQAVNVAKIFHENVHLTGVILSKMDSDARGGAALSIRSVVQVPIRFIGTGEKMTDLEVFHPERMAQRILDMGDILSLVEKAQEVVDEKSSKKTFENLLNKKFTIEDFVQQLEFLKKMGPLGGLMKMIPGMGGLMSQMGGQNMGNLDDAQEEINKIRVIINSMTPQERKNEKLLSNESRKKRIAKGSGTSVVEINNFLTKFNQIKTMMIQMSGMLPGMPGGGKMPTLPPQMQPPGQQTKKKSSGPWGKGFF